MNRTERAIKADLTERRAELTTERDQAVELHRQLTQAIPMLTGAINEITRLLTGFDEHDDDAVDDEAVA